MRLICDQRHIISTSCRLINHHFDMSPDINLRRVVYIGRLEIKVVTEATRCSSLKESREKSPKDREAMFLLSNVALRGHPR